MEVCSAKGRAQLEGVAFVGQTLAPLFLNDPAHGALDAELAAMATLDVDAAAKEWPFVEAEAAHEALSLMKQGLEEGLHAEALVWEYRRLFVGPAKMPCPPWGSVYTDRDCVVFGESTLALRAWMRKTGIKRLGDEKTPEDHIGLMLALMAWIAQEKPELLKEFLINHLLPWSSHYLEQLDEAAQHPFYKGLAQIAKASLEGMQDAFGLEVSYPRFFR